MADQTPATNQEFVGIVRQELARSGLETTALQFFEDRVVALQQRVDVLTARVAELEKQAGAVAIQEMA